MIVALERMQRELEAIYGLQLPLRVSDFLLPAGPRPGGGGGASEALLISQEGEELSLGLYLEPALLARLALHDPDDPLPSMITEGLPDFTTVLEGVSHFVYLAWRALRDEEVSLLELEIQAEIDKFVASLLHLWRRGQKGASAALRERLFERVRFRESLSEGESDRYRTANDLARGYCRLLEARFLAEGSPEGLLREVRRLYRLGGAQKRAHLRRSRA
ncbi:MAG: hypothetical protein P1V51_16700 [Deltaproteobacteria bacterium]|nr:hypothetical protein [Deltaproteobacteria bacterium]